MSTLSPFCTCLLADCAGMPILHIENCEVLRWRCEQILVVGFKSLSQEGNDQPSRSTIIRELGFSCILPSFQPVSYHVLPSPPPTFGATV